MHFGGDSGALGVANWMPIVADLGHASGAPAGEVAAACPFDRLRAGGSTISGRTAGAVGIREWGCVDIRSKCTLSENERQSL